MRRMIENNIRCIVFNNDALVHENNAVRNFCGKGHLMRNDEHGESAMCQVFNNAQHLADHFRVQSTGWFIE